jgi:hypothetical protein
MPFVSFLPAGKQGPLVCHVSRTTLVSPAGKLGVSLFSVFFYLFERIIFWHDFFFIRGPLAPASLRRENRGSNPGR